MGRNKKPRKKKRRQPPAERLLSRSGYVSHVLTEADRHAMHTRAHVAAAEAAELFPKALADVTQALGTFSPLHLIMTLARAGLLAGVGKDGVVERPEAIGIEQADVELLLGLAVTMAPDAWGMRPPLPPDIQRLIDATKMAREAFGVMRMSAMGTQKSEAERAALALQERVRLHTQVVRNWGYGYRVLALVRDLLAPLDVALERATGMTASALVSVYEALVHFHEEAYSNHLQRMQRVFQETTMDGTVRAYHREHPDLVAEPDDFAEAMPGLTLSNLRYMLLAHSDFRMAWLAMVDVGQVAARTGLPEVMVERCLAATAIMPAAVDDAKRTHVFMANPIWEAPAIGIDGHYAVPVPQLFFSHVLPIVDRVFKAAGLSPQLDLQRASFLESQVERCFRRAFPTANVHPGGKWAWKGRTWETDLIVVVDRTLLIVEAKSARLSPSALRGAPDRLKKHIGEAVEAPAIQSARFADMVDQAQLGDKDALAITQSFDVVANDIDQVLRLSVTIDDYSPIGAMESELKAAGWLSPDTDLAPVMSIADLECVIELLERPAHILHYLQTRMRLQRQVMLIGDELDCLGSYLADGLVVPTKDERPILQIVGQSAVVDRYFINLGEGFEPERPRRQLPTYFEQLLTQLAERAAPGWTTASLAILNGLDTHTAEGLNDAMERLRVSVPGNQRDEGECSVVFVPKDPADLPVAYLVFAEKDHARRFAFVDSLIQQLLEKTGRRRCLVVARMVEAWEMPYAFFAIGQAQDEAAED